MSRCHHCGNDCGHDKFTFAFMLRTILALRVILHKLDQVLDRLPELPKKATHLEIKFGQPDTPKET